MNTLKPRFWRATAFVAVLTVLPAMAAAQSTFSLSGELASQATITTDYRFRGVSQTFGDPAIQAGTELLLPSQFYLGTWASTVDKQVLVGSRGIEWDLYGGYRWALENGLKFDVGLIQYVYPGESSLNTLEAYGSANFDFVTFTYFNGLSNKFFGVSNARGSAYYDLTVEYPVGPSLMAVAHYGIQQVSNNEGDYSDYSIGLKKQWKGVELGLTMYGTDSDLNVTSVAGRTKDLGDRGFVFSVSKSF